MTEEKELDTQENVEAAIEAAANLRLARGIARALWLPGFKDSNPDSDQETTNEAWRAVRQQETKPVLRALRLMLKRGYTFSEPDSDDE